MLRFNFQKIAASQQSDRRLLPRYILGRFVGLERRQSWNRAPPLGDPESSTSEGLRSKAEIWKTEDWFKKQYFFESKSEKIPETWVTSRTEL